MLYKGLKYLHTYQIYSFEAEMKHWYETFNLHFPPQGFYCLMFEKFELYFVWESIRKSFGVLTFGICEASLWNVM